MVRSLIEMRGLAAMLVAAAVGVWGLTAFPLSRDNPFLELVALRNPMVFRALSYSYAALWFSSPFFVATLFQPQLTSKRTGRPHPLVIAFAHAASSYHTQAKKRARKTSE